MLASLTRASDRAHHGATIRLGANIGYSFAAGLGIGEGGEIGWSMLLPSSARWDFQLGAGLQHSVIRRSLIRTPNHAPSSSSMGVIGVALDFTGRRWQGDRGSGWFMVIGARAIVQVWGYINAPRANRQRRVTISFPPAWTPDQYRFSSPKRDAMYPIVPALIVSAGYRFTQYPVEISAEYVHEGVMRFFPAMYHPLISHLLTSIYGGISASWWF